MTTNYMELKRHDDKFGYNAQKSQDLIEKQY